MITIQQDALNAALERSHTRQHEERPDGRLFPGAAGCQNKRHPAPVLFQRRDRRARHHECRLR